MKKRIIAFALVVITITSLLSISASAYTLGVNTWKYGNLILSNGTPGQNDTIYLGKGKTYTIQLGINLDWGMINGRNAQSEWKSFTKKCYFTVNIYTDTNKFIKSYTNVKVGDRFTLPKTVNKYRVDIIKHFPVSLGRSFERDNCHNIGYRVAKV